MPRLALNPSELVAIYAMLSMASAMGGLDMVLVVTPILVHYQYGATPENDWNALFEGKLQNDLLVHSQEAITAFYEGNSTFYVPEHYQPWVFPVLAWTGFLTTLFFTTMCLNVIFLREWTKKERLTFPIVVLPLVLATRPKSLCMNYHFMVGALLAGSITMLNGLNHLYPDFPAIPIRAYDINLSSLFRGLGHPWNAVGWFPISWYPCVIGLSYLMPLELLFSCWFFFLFWKAQKVLLAWFGLTPLLPKAYLVQEATGAYFAIAFGAFWIAREHLRDVLRKVIHGSDDEEDKHEPLQYRTAFLGACIGFFGLVMFASWAGLSPKLAVIYFLLYLGISVGIARMRATCGPPAHDLHFAGPGEMLTTTIGTENIDGQSLGAMGLFFGFNRAYRGHPTAHSIESFRLGQQTNANQRMIFAAQFFGLAFGCLCAFWAYLHISYSDITGTPLITYYRGNETFGRLQRWLTHSEGPQNLSWIFYSFGFAVVALMPMLKLYWPSLPFHPIGFAISSSWSMHLVWFPILIGWMFKWSIVRYGGGAAYRKLLPFFLGLILGDYVVGGIWCLYSLAAGKGMYSFWY